MKNRMMRIASVLLVAVLLSTCVISGTYAKYASEYTGESTARVAKWAFTFANDVNDEKNEFTFDLFEYTDASVDVNGAEDRDKVIAPGTTGSFALEITNASEVSAKYKVTLEAENADNIPIEYSLVGGESAQDWTQDITQLNVFKDKQSNEIDNGFASIAYGETADTITVYWRWVFENSTDDDDTTLGEAGTATVTVTATVNVEQVD